MRDVFKVVGDATGHDFTVSRHWLQYPNGLRACTSVLNSSVNEAPFQCCTFAHEHLASSLFKPPPYSLEMSKPHQSASALRARLPQTRVYLDRPHAYREVNAHCVRACCVCALAASVFVRELMSTLLICVRACVRACVWLAFNVCAVLDQAPARHSANYRFTEGSMHGPGILSFLDDTRILHVSWIVWLYVCHIF
jgi:hypothetical protein